MANSGRILGWTFGAVGIVAAAVLGFWLLTREDRPDTAGDGEVTVITRGTGLRETRAPMNLPPPPDRPPPVAEPSESPPPAIGAITGRIITAGRQVLREGRVEAMRGALSSLPGLTELTPLAIDAEIASDGRFVLSELPAMDDLVLRVDGKTFALTDVGTFVVEPGQTTDLGDVIVSAGMEVTGRVVDERGQSVEGAQIGLFAGDRRGQPPGDEELPTIVTISDGNGRFRIPHSPVRSFAVTVYAEGYANAMAHGAVMPGSQPTSVAVQVTMRKVRPLRGRVVGNPGGEPLEGAVVRAVPLDPGLGGGRGITDADGRFELTDVAYGNYMVEATLSGYSVGRDRTLTKRDDYEVEIELRKQGSLKGFVVGADGQPVTRFDLQPQFHRRSMSPEIPTGDFRRIADPDGAFELQGLEAGFTCVHVWAKGYALTMSECFRVRRGEDVEGVVVTLVRGATLTGVVFDDRGLPVANARVSLHRNKEPEIAFLRGTSGRPAMMKDTRTGSDGRFRLRDLTGMTYQVEIDHPDFAIVRRNNVTVEQAIEQEAEPFILDREARVEGVVVAPNGQLKAGYTVNLMRVGGFSQQTAADGRGHFVFTRLAPGEYQLSCYGPSTGFAAALYAATNPPEPFRVDAGQTVKHNVVSVD